ncbi:hypothetical protein I7I53_00859 [Histoplasma capsulatum var. duboisii H88]|uniref:Uncharacterized protein n=1 Tax=Ajellomyces capsulatus (strain H88) TaxID=544711 RepID=A0A8A1LM91_AJEC8|nr:hypothetical protein I7I53_00859 [Histoplasma capsulatum var. duboisii H88]
MTSQYNDRVVWLCLGATLFFAVRGVAAELHRIRELTTIRNGEKDDQVIGEGTEDALKLETLQKLSESTSFDLRAAALRIISERSTKGSTRDLLLEDLSSKDPTLRNKALNALYFLVSNRALSRSSVTNRLKDLPTYTALVNCLCNFLAEHTEENIKTVSPILPRTRPQGEKKALNTLDIILRENVPAALEAGVISRWLSKYPFPCTTEDESKRIDVVVLTKTWYTDDSVMSSIISTLSSHQEGVSQLRKYGLMSSRMAEHTHSVYDDEIGDEYDHDDGSENDSDVWMVGGEETAGLPLWAGGRRRQEGTAEEQELRRQRREAMVFSESGRPLGRDDIIHPVRNREDEELDAELEQLADEVDRELREEQLEAERQARPRRSWSMWPFS